MRFRQAILEAPKVSDDHKLQVAADIDSLQGQLQKPTPGKSIVKELWSFIEKGATAAGFADLAAKMGALIAPLIS
jgi:hypothetical protein